MSDPGLELRLGRSGRLGRTQYVGRRKKTKKNNPDGDTGITLYIECSRQSSNKRGLDWIYFVSGDYILISEFITNGKHNLMFSSEIVQMGLIVLT